jgi:hypothetical protein
MIDEEKFWKKKRFPVAAVPWTDEVNSTPIEDMRQWIVYLGNIYARYGNQIEFNIKTFQYITQSYELKKWKIKISKPSDIISLLMVDVVINENLLIGKVIIKSTGNYHLEATVL